MSTLVLPRSVSRELCAWLGGASRTCAAPWAAHQGTGARTYRDEPDFSVAQSFRGVLVVSKRTYQPNNRRRPTVNGFRLPMRTRAGPAILNRPPPNGTSQPPP